MGKCLSVHNSNKEKNHHVMHPSSSRSKISRIFKFNKALGSGSQGTVRRGYKRDNPEQLFAIKSIDKTRLCSKQMASLKTELDILLQMDHPNIIKLYQSYEDQTHLHLVMEHCSGGNLLQKIVKKKKFSQKQTSFIMQKVFLAVNYLHTVGFSHRDIKLENFIWSDSSSNSEIKLIDFGFSSSVQKVQRLNTRLGTLQYIAPQIIEGGSYQKSCDLWSTGVMMFVLLTGCYPYIGSSNEQILKNINNINNAFKSSALKGISVYAKDLLRKLLNYDPKQRLTAAQALKHPWFSKQSSPRSPYNHQILYSLKTLSNKAQFEKEVRIVIVKNLEFQQLQELKETFVCMDTSNTGYLSFQEVRIALKQAGFELAGDQVKKIIEKAGCEGNDRINYSQFLAATLTSKVKLNQEILLKAFNIFDTDKTGFITLQNLQQVFLKSGKQFTQQELKKMISEVDYQQDNRISFDEFKLIFSITNQVLNELSISSLRRKFCRLDRSFQI